MKPAEGGSIVGAGTAVGGTVVDAVLLLKMIQQWLPLPPPSALPLVLPSALRWVDQLVLAWAPEPQCLWVEQAWQSVLVLAYRKQPVSDPG